MENIRKSYEKIITPIIGLSNGKPGQIAYYAAFAAVYVFRFYYTSMFTSLSAKPVFLAIPYYVGYLLLAGLAALAVVDALRSSKREALFLCAILITGALSAYFGKNYENTLPLCLLIVASRKRNVRPVFILSVILGSIVLLSAYYASMNGYIPYLVYERGNDGLLSHAFGMNYRTDLAAHVLYIIMCYAVIRGEKLHLWEYLMLVFDCWLVWRYTYARIASFCIAAFLVLAGLALLAFYIRKRISGKAEWFAIPKWTSVVHIIGAVFSFAIVAWWAHIKNNGFSAASSDSFQERLSYSIQAFQKYPLTLFGQLVEERGAGGMPDTSIQYFFIDIFYIRILILGGVAMLILYLCLMSIASFRAAKESQIILAIALIMIAFDSMIEHHAFELSYNVLIVYSLGCFRKDNCRSEILTPHSADPIALS